MLELGSAQDCKPDGGVKYKLNFKKVWNKKKIKHDASL